MAPTAHSSAEPTDRPLPKIAPILATLGTLPPAAQDELFGYELRWDGDLR